MLLTGLVQGMGVLAVVLAIPFLRNLFSFGWQA